MIQEQSAEIYQNDVLLLIVWKHNGSLSKQLTIAVEGQTIPKPYLGAPTGLADTAVFVILTASPLQREAARLSITDRAGQCVFVSESTGIFPLAQLPAAFDKPSIGNQLIVRILKHAPVKLPRWNTALSKALALLLDDAKPLISRRSSAGSDWAGKVERLDDGVFRGWASDRRRPFTALGVEVYREGQLLQTVTADRYRPELKAHGNTGRYGFEVDLTDAIAGDGPHTIEFRFAGSATHLGGSPCLIVAGRLTRQATVPAAADAGYRFTLERIRNESPWVLLIDGRWEDPRAEIESLLLVTSDETQHRNLFEDTAQNGSARLSVRRDPGGRGGLFRHRYEFDRDKPPAEPRAIRAILKSGRVVEQLLNRVVDVRASIDYIDGRRVAGWALDCGDPGKTLTLLFEVDGQEAGSAVANEPRDDLELLGADIRHGFQVSLDKDLLAPTGRREYRLSIRDQETGKLLVDGYRFHYQPHTPKGEYASFARRLDRLEQTLRELREEMPHIRQRSAYSLEEYGPWYEEIGHSMEVSGAPSGEPTARVCVLVPVTPHCTLHRLQRVLESLLRQSGAMYECLIVNRGQRDQAYAVLVRSYQGRIPKLQWIDADTGLSRAYLAASVQQATADYVLLLAPGECLAAGALACITDSAEGSGADLIYGDSDRIDDEGQHADPELRPDFNPDLLLSNPYIGSFCIERGLLQKLGPELGDEPEGIWQYDLLLRAAEALAPERWRHVARVLTHRPQDHLATSSDNDSAARALAVLQASLERCGLPVTAEIDDTRAADQPKVLHSPEFFAARLRWQLPKEAPKVSIVIPTCDSADLVRNCIDSILGKTDYPDYEILLIDHDSSEKTALRYFAELEEHRQVRVLRYSGIFNWSAINTFGASHATGQVLCFLNNDTEVITTDWLTEMVAHACRLDIGAVGAKLLYEDGTVQHAGVILGISGVADHPFVGLPADEAGYLLRAGLTQNLSAVTGACLVCRREVFEHVGGFDIVNLGVTFNDVDFCLRISEAGYRIVWTPHARLYHLESKSRGRDTSPDKKARLAREIAYMRDRWGRLLDRDPYYNPAFELYAEPFTALTCKPWPALAKPLSGPRRAGAPTPALPPLAQMLGVPDAAHSQRSGCDFYVEPIPELAVENYPPFRRLHLAIWQLRSADLQRLFPLGSADSRARFLDWCAVDGVQEYAALGELTDTLVAPAKSRNGAGKRAVPAKPAELPFGVNLIGYAFAELGVGEDVRMAAQALHAAGVPFTIIDFAPGGDIRQGDHSVGHWVSNEFKYSINLVCLTVLEHFRWFAEKGRSVCEGRYTIGYWPWELQVWPKAWHHCFSLVDEVWASSRHIEQAIRAVSPVPVHYMPMAVALPEIKRQTRVKWKLPKNVYLFVFSFDGNSSIARQHPLAVVRAFQQAFPNGGEAVGLVIKASRQDPAQPVWQEICAAAEQDGRIRIIDRTLTQPEVLALYQQCDCFVSLHRAEGFGRRIAEALLLGLDVIATGYGGIVDFCVPAGALSIPYDLVPVGEGEYVEAEGQVWAEPDQSVAVLRMQNLVESAAVRRGDGLQTVSGTMADLFAQQPVGARYQSRLREVTAGLRLVENGTATWTQPAISRRARGTEATTTSN